MAERGIVSGRVGVPPAGLRVSRKRTFELLRCARKDCSGETRKPAGGTPTLPETMRHLSHKTARPA